MSRKRKSTSVISDELTEQCMRDPLATNAVVITLKDGVSALQRQSILNFGAVPIADHIFLSGSFDWASLQALVALDGVEHIEEDIEVGIL